MGLLTQQVISIVYDSFFTEFRHKPVARVQNQFVNCSCSIVFCRYTKMPLNTVESGSFEGIIRILNPGVLSFKVIADAMTDQVMQMYQQTKDEVDLSIRFTDQLHV